MAIPNGFWTMMGTSQGGTNVHMGLFEVYKIWQWVKAVGPKPLSSFGKDFTSQLRLVCFNFWDVN